MAKNTSSSAFRKIDIDQYNEDNFRDDEAEQAVPTGPDEGDVCALLNQGRYIDALHLVLSNAPMGSSNQQVKDNALALTLKVLLAIKSGQIEEAVGSLSLDDIDILMKYIYRGFEYPSEGSSGHLLLWHEKAFNVGGSGSIVRVLSDRMRHSHTIPVEGYETELQDLGEHVDHHETPIKVIKITKTIAVKVPVPYPVKVVQKVPYPVHIVKPYPVPVPHIVKVPQPIQKHAHEGGGGGFEGNHGGSQAQSYEVQETPTQDSGNGHSFLPIQEDSYNGAGLGQNIESFAEEYPSNEGSPGSSYDGPSSYYGNSGAPDEESFESRSYEQAIQAYLNTKQPGGGKNFNGYH